jgi:hypothetical protein
VQLTVRVKPAHKAHRGLDPATGQEIVISAEPASVDVRARPLARAKAALPTVEKARRRLAAHEVFEGGAVVERPTPGDAAAPPEPFSPGDAPQREAHLRPDERPPSARRAPALAPMSEVLNHMPDLPEAVPFPEALFHGGRLTTSRSIAFDRLAELVAPELRLEIWPVQHGPGALLLAFRLERHPGCHGGRFAARREDPAATPASPTRDVRTARRRRVGDRANRCSTAAMPRTRCRCRLAAGMG